MAEIEYAGNIREIGIALDGCFGQNTKLEEDMSRTIRHYQRLALDADSHPVVIKMEKELGKNLLEIARLTLGITLKAIDISSETDLHYSDQGNKIHHGMKLASFCLGYCSVAESANNPGVLYPIKKGNMVHNRMARLYAAAFIDNNRQKRILHLFAYHNSESELLGELKLEIAKYENTIGLRGYDLLSPYM